MSEAEAAKNLGATKNHTKMGSRKAVVVGATNGIGKACANNLARAGFSVIAVGRDKPGRAEAITSELTKNSPADSSPCHEFRVCDAFSLKAVKDCAENIVKDHKSIDALVMSQGMATIQSFTETVDGNDEKMTLHFWSRMAFTDRLLPSLRRSTEMHGGPCVMSILSGGVHNPYKKIDTDPYLKKSYSVQNAADAAGFYTDLFLDLISRRKDNENITFIHASPGFVKTNWGTELPWIMRKFVRGMQKVLAKDANECAEFMCEPIIQCTTGKLTKNTPGPGGILILTQNGSEGKLTKEHSEENMKKVWDFTSEVLLKVGIDINK